MMKSGHHKIEKHRLKNIDFLNALLTIFLPLLQGVTSQPPDPPPATTFGLSSMPPGPAVRPPMGPPMGPPDGSLDEPPVGSKDGPAIGPPGSKNRYTKPTTTQKRLKRTTPPRMSFAEDCDYLAYYCMKAYKTGVVCGRTIYYNYANFMTYCQLDYVNCMERYEVWQLAHMGECMEVEPLKDYLHYEYTNDDFLDRDFVSDD